MTVRRSRRFALSVLRRAVARRGGPQPAPARPSGMRTRARAAVAKRARPGARGSACWRSMRSASPSRTCARCWRRCPRHASLPCTAACRSSTMAPFARVPDGHGLSGTSVCAIRATARSATAASPTAASWPATIAWHYERDGLMPMLIGHSQGGMLALKVLQDLAGASGAALPVWNPMRGAAEARSTIVDPRTGLDAAGGRAATALCRGTGHRQRDARPARPVGHAGAPAQRARFGARSSAGYFIAWDPIAGTGPDAARDNPYRADRQRARAQRHAAVRAMAT